MDYLVTLAPSIIAALTILLAYLQNRDNNRSKRSELAFQKRLDAFSEIFKAFNDTRQILDNLLEWMAIRSLQQTDETEHKQLEDTLNVEKQFQDAWIAVLSIDKYFSTAYGLNRIYVPAYIDKEILNYQKFLSKVSKMPGRLRSDKNSLHQVLLQHDQWSEMILEMMHKFIGF